MPGTTTDAERKAECRQNFDPLTHELFASTWSALTAAAACSGGDHPQHCTTQEQLSVCEHLRQASELCRQRLCCTREARLTAAAAVTPAGGLWQGKQWFDAVPNSQCVTLCHSTPVRAHHNALRPLTGNTSRQQRHMAPSGEQNTLPAPAEGKRHQHCALEAWAGRAAGVPTPATPMRQQSASKTTPELHSKASNECAVVSAESGAHQCMACTHAKHLQLETAKCLLLLGRALTHARAQQPPLPQQRVPQPATKKSKRQKAPGKAHGCCCTAKHIAGALCRVHARHKRNTHAARPAYAVAASSSRHTQVRNAIPAQVYAHVDSLREALRQTPALSDRSGVLGHPHASSCCRWSPTQQLAQSRQLSSSDSRAGVARVLVRCVVATQGGGRTEWSVQPCNVHAVNLPA